MALNIVNRGSNNVISYSEKDEPQLSGIITIRGSGNHLMIGRGTLATNVNILLGSDCAVTVGGECSLGGLSVHANKKATVVIGRGSGFVGRVRLLLHEPGRIDIGADCLLASEVDVTVSDIHSIIDVASGKRVNPARDVMLEERVWVGQRAMILKGSHIEAGSIVGAGAVVAGRIPAYSLAVGIPAKVIRTGVTWNRKLL